jgi:hypothetical protein
MLIISQDIVILHQACVRTIYLFNLSVLETFEAETW